MNAIGKLVSIWNALPIDVMANPINIAAPEWRQNNLARQRIKDLWKLGADFRYPANRNQVPRDALHIQSIA